MLALLGAALIIATLWATTLAYALRDYSRTRLGSLLASGRKHSGLAWLEERSGELPVLMGIIRTTSNLCLFAVVLLWWFGDAPVALSISGLAPPALIALAALLLFSLSLPQALARHAGEHWIAACLPLLMLLHILMRPLALFVSAVDWLVRTLLGVPARDSETESEQIEAEILDVVSEGELQGSVDEEQSAMIQSVFALHDTTVAAIMTPRTRIAALPVDATTQELRETMRRHQHSRVPIYDGSIDRILGVLYAKDLLGVDLSRPLDLRKLLRHVPVVPESKPIDELLQEFRAGKVHIAIVVDEYGGTSGLVTIEDILEEVVGEIDDEFDDHTPVSVRRINEHTIETDGDVHVADVNAALDAAIPEEGAYETIGGFVAAQLGRIAKTGDEITFEQIVIHVLDADERKINRVRIGLRSALPVIPAEQAG